MKKIKTIALASMVVLAANIMHADTLTLIDGQSLQGKLVSRSDAEVVFKVAGQEMKFPAAKVKALNLDMGTSAPAAAVKAATPAAVAPATSGAATVAAGTMLTIKLSSSLDTKKHSQGHKFTAVLEANLMAGTTVVAPRGATVYGRVVEAKKSGRLVGKASMLITFTDVMINNKMHPIQTSSIAATTSKGTGASSVGRVGRAAAIGGLADGSKGAKTGAKIGLGAAVLTGGNQVNVPAGTLFDIALSAPLSLK